MSNDKEGTMEADPFKPSATLLAKLGSAIVHADEAMSDQGHAADEAAFRSLLTDQEVQDWLAAMQVNALVPVKRDV